MKRIIFLTALLAAFALCGCGSSDVDNVSYESVGNVSFSVPSSWEPDLSSSSDGTAYYYPPDGMLLVMTGLDPIDGDVDSFLDGFLDDGSEVLSVPEAVAIDGYDGFRFTANVVLEDIPQQADVVVFDTSDGAAAFYMGTNLDSDENYSGDFQAVVNSIIVGSSSVDDSGAVLDDGEYQVAGIDDSVHPQSVRNDSTGSWKYCMIAQSGLTAEDFAYNYYKTCFESGDTVHYIVNVSANTTTCISDIGGFVSVTTTEYVDGEEHDASTLGSGMVLGSWNMSPNTGEMESTTE